MARFAFTTAPRSVYWVIAGLGLLTVVGLIRTFWNKGPDAEGASQLPLVSVREVRPADLADVVTFTGAITARDEAAISAEGEGGRVAALFVDVGDRVARGQVLAKLDNSLIAPQVASLEASLEESKANAAVAEAEYRRAQAVASIGALSQQEIERRGAAAVAAASKVKVVSSQLAEARARLGRTEVRAPFDGVILTRAAEVGQLASPGAGPLFRVGRRGSIEMRGNVAERDLPRLKVGQIARVRVTGVDQPFEGKVRLIGAVIEPTTRLGSVRIELNEHRDLRPGAFARGEVETGRGSRPVIPQTSVMSDGNGNFVYLVAAGDQVERRDIRIAGSRVDGLIVESGLQGGERLIETAGPYLRVGEKIRVAK